MKTNVIHIGSVAIGGGNAISVQSMTTTDTRDVKSTVEQIHKLEKAGCDIVRLAVIDENAAKAIKEIKKEVSIPIVADIHFNHKLAVISMESGVDALRLNPGNIRKKEYINTVIDEAKRRNIVIRVGVNGGSIDTVKYKEANAENMLSSAAEHISLMEERGFTNIKVSLKSSDIKTTIEANRLFSSKYNYPIHLGITEAGTIRSSLVKSSLGIGTLLMEGIGDTIRFSITGDPVQEVIAGHMLLKFLSLTNKKSIEIISCPTCGRTKGNVEDVASEIEMRTRGIEKNITIAVMGCVVNGPGEAKHANFGVAANQDGDYIFFEKTNTPIKIKRKEVIEFIMKKIDEY